MAKYLGYEAFRPKVVGCINKYLSLSENQSLTVGIYRGGERFVFGNDAECESNYYDVGSISKTMTAHLCLKIAEERSIDLNRSVSDFIDLPRGNYPTLYQLLSHTVGYGHLTPAEITLPSLLRHGYSRRNIYEGCTAESVVKSLSRRKNLTPRGYSYSDFPLAVIAVALERITGEPFANLIEDFVQGDLGMKSTVISLPEHLRYPKSALVKRTVDFWRWERDNPYVAGGGLVSTVGDMLNYIAVQVESGEPYIRGAHRLCRESVSERSDVVTCIGWHSYKKSNQLWHVGGVGTFRSSIIINRPRKIGVVVLGNSKGKASANVHYLAKMLYSELKIKKINF